jgi:hypothetical protein
MAYARVGNFVIPGPAGLPLVLRYPVRGLGDDYCTSGDAVVPCGYVAPSPSPASPAASGNWDQFWQGLTAGGLNILGKVVSPPAYQQITRDQYGNVISTTVAQGAAGAPGTMAALGGSISPNVVLIGGGAVLLLLFAALMKKGN